MRSRTLALLCLASASAFAESAPAPPAGRLAWSESGAGAIRGITIGPIENTLHPNKGYGSEAMRLLLRFAFRELGYEKIGLSAYEFNTRALTLYEHLGFQHEARRRRAVYTDGRRWDEIYLGMTRAEYEAQHAAWFPDDGRRTMDDGR